MTNNNLVLFTSVILGRICRRTFTRTWRSSLISSSLPQSVAVADLNNDQQMDIVVANTGTDNIGVFISKDNETFEQPKTYSTGLNSLPCSVLVGELVT